MRIIENIRRNHALEHATVSLLLSRFGPSIQVVGRSSNDGFFLFGRLPPKDVEECARDGLARLKRGESFWAVSPLCGTNLAVAGAMAALSTMAVIGNGSRKGKTGDAIAAAVLAVTLAQPIGRLLQHHVTTSADLGDTEIVSITTTFNGLYHKVRTRRVTA